MTLHLELARRSALDLERLGYDNVHVKEGDGYRGWPEHAPFDATPTGPSPAGARYRCGSCP